MGFECCKNKEENNENDSDSSNDSDNNRIKSLNTQEIPSSSTDIIIKTDTLVRSYDFSPYKKYEELSILGEGTYGLVKKVCLINNKKTIRAMKIISKKNILKGQSNKLFEEIEILRRLEHPNIMKIYEYFIDDKNIYIITEFCDQGDLLGKMKKLYSMSELVVKYLMSQILDALAYLHDNRVFHGDIKLENIMLYKTSRKKIKRFTVINKDLNSDVNLQNKLDNVSGQTSDYVEDMSNYEIKLIDFGCSKYLTKKKNNVLSGIVGTSIYCSPEVIDNSYDEKSDEWSCGVLMYILLYGDTPFAGNTEEEIFENIKNYNIDFDKLENVSENCLDLIKKLINPKKQYRITALEALRHPFFTEKLNPKNILTHHKDLSILKRYKKIKKYPTILHKVVVAYCCFNYISQEEEKKLKELFLFLDENNVKKLREKDFIRGFEKAKISISPLEIKDLMNLLDSDGSKVIEYQEFLRAFCDKDLLLNNDNLKIIFEIIDKDKKGYININDIKDFILGNDKNKLKESAMKNLSKKIGIDNNSKIEFKQFCDIIRNTDEEKDKIEKQKSCFENSGGVVIEEENKVMNKDFRRGSLNLI
jgi:calcium-dependent protein kinase